MSIEREPFRQAAQTATKTILLVEDDPNISLLLEEAIAQETPYRAIVESDSHAALNLVRHFKPRLFILDYGLPGMNGIELYDRLHINLELASVPAILITANHQVPQRQIQQRQLITFMKPIELVSFLDKIETLLTAT